MIMQLFSSESYNAKTSSRTENVGKREREKYKLKQQEKIPVSKIENTHSSDW